jgi:hypothetical protein
VTNRRLTHPERLGLMDYHVVFAQLERVVPVPLIVQGAEESDATRVRKDLLRWGEPPVTRARS